MGISEGSVAEIVIKIKIESIDKDGNVKAELIQHDGKGRLKGKIDDKGNLQLEGFVVAYTEWKVTLTATVEDKALTNGKYRNESHSTEKKGVFNIAVLEGDR